MEKEAAKKAMKFMAKSYDTCKECGKDMDDCKCKKMKKKKARIKG